MGEPLDGPTLRHRHEPASSARRVIGGGPDAVQIHNLVQAFRETGNLIGDVGVVLRVVVDLCRDDQRLIDVVHIHLVKQLLHTAALLRIRNRRRVRPVRPGVAVAIDDHLSRSGIKAYVTAGPFQGHYRVNYLYSITNKMYPIGVIIPTKNNFQCLYTLFKSIVYSHTPHWYAKFLIMDNGSTDKKTIKLLRELKDFDSLVNLNVEVIKYPKKFNFSVINNYAAEKLRDVEAFLFMNDDIEVMHPEWLLEMLSHINRPNVAAVGPKLLYLDHRIQHAGIFVGVNGVAGHSHKHMNDWEPGYFSRPHVLQDITAVTGACMMVRSEDFFSVGGFEEKLPKAFNDIDLCLKLREKGKRIIYTPYARLYHKESVSRGKDSLKDKEFQEAINFMETKWNLRAYSDPFYNPNLPENCEGKPWI